MRLEKHTPEEIEEAKKESGHSIPTEEQLEEWKKVHTQINRRMASVGSGSGLGIANLNTVIFPLLGESALKVARICGTTTVLELYRNDKTGKHFPWSDSGLLGYDYITKEALEGLDLNRTFVLCQFISKVIEVTKGNKEELEYWIKRFAAVFNRLAYYNKIDYGILSSFMALPLADLETEWRVQEYRKTLLKDGDLCSVEAEMAVSKIREESAAEAKTMRIALMVYPYTHFSPEELNDWLHNPAFVREGEIGTLDWSGLPDV